MKKILCVILTAVLCAACLAACADGWVVPGGNAGCGGGFGGISARLTDDLATRSGPSTTYTGCGSYRMKGQYVTVLSRAYDNGGVLWVEVEFQYGGGYRRAWTGAKRLDLSAGQLKAVPEENMRSFCGYGTVRSTAVPRFGPGSLYATYGDRNFRAGDQVAVIRISSGYCLVERYHTDGHVLRCWIPADQVQY